MKMLTLCLTVILITTFTSLLFSESLPQLQLQGADTNYADAIDVNLNGNIFYKDPDNNVLLRSKTSVKKSCGKAAEVVCSTQP